MMAKKSGPIPGPMEDNMAEEKKKIEEPKKEADSRTEEEKKAFEDWKKKEEAIVPHPYITPDPVPFGKTPRSGFPPDANRVKDPEHPTLEELQRGSIPVDNIAAKDTPSANLAFRKEIEDKLVEAAGHPEPNRVGNELTRLENAVTANFTNVLALNNFLDSVKDKLDDDQKKKLDELMIRG